MRVRRALAMSAADRYASMLLGAVLVAVVSRLLSPHEVGVTVLGLTVFALVEIVRDVATSYLIQRHDVTRDDVRASFTIMFLLSGAAAALVLLAASTIAAHQDEEGLVAFFHVIAIAIMIGPFERPLTALMRREMLFDLVAAINVASAASNVVLTITLAMLGFSYMAAAWALLGSNLTSLLVVHAFTRHRGMLGFSLQGWRSVLRIGGSSSLWGVTLRLTDTLPNLTFAALGVLGAVGLFGRAQSLVDMPGKLLFAIISPVALPALAARKREGESLKRPVLDALGYLTVLHWPAFLILACLAHPVTMLLLGPQWAAVVPILQILAISRLFAALDILVYPILMALGASRELLLTAMLPLPLHAILVVLAAKLGPIAVAACYLVLAPISFAITFAIIRRPLAIGLADLFAATSKSLVVTLGTMMGPLALLAATGFRLDLSLARSIGIVGLAAVGWLASLAVTQHPLWIELRRMVDGARHRKALHVGAEP